MACTNFAWPRLAAAALCLALPACRPAPEKPVEPAPQPAPVVTGPAIPTPPPPLGRAELIGAAEAAASAYAAGQPAPEAATALAGRRFAIRLPFGCGGPPAESAPVRYAYDAEDKTLRLYARPETWTKAPWARALAGSPETEAIEGFWIRRPWLKTEGCPATAASDMALLRSPETLGLAQVFDKGGSRLLRRGARGYEATLNSDAPPGPQGLRLTLEGRIAGAEGAGPLRCRSESPDQRPACLIVVELERVAFEDPEGKTLSEWRS